MLNILSLDSPIKEKLNINTDTIIKNIMISLEKCNKINIELGYKIIFLDIKNICYTSIPKHETVNILKNKPIHSNKFNTNVIQ